MDSSLDALQKLLAYTHALSWTAWTFHWTTSGNNFYSDHLLYQRIYEETHGQIDGLAEKIIGLYGSNSIQAAMSLHMSGEAADRYAERVSPIDLLDMVNGVLSQVTSVRESLLEERNLTSGMDNYLQAMEDLQESHKYLLGQRVR